MQRTLFFLIFTLISFGSSIKGQEICNNPKITNVFGDDTAVIDCNYPLNATCLSLKVDYPTLKATTSYEVSPANFIPYGAFNSGTPLYANADDLFINKVKLPFNFCYFGSNYSEIVVGSNGVVTFDVAQLGKVNYPNVADQNPNITLPKASIFGPFSDMVFSSSDDSEIYYNVVGTAPCRKFIINFYKGRMLGCEQTATSQIVLSEATNTIEIFIESKPLICEDAKFDKSLIGIINNERNIGYTPPDRNSGIWETQNEAWIFYPTGATVIPQITWFNAANQKVGTGDAVNVCPQQNELYTVKINYPICGKPDFVLEDKIEVKFDDNYPLAKDYTQVFCGTNSIEVNMDDYLENLTPQNPDNLKFTFHNTLADAQNGINEQGKIFQLNSNRIFHVRAESKSDPSCFRTAILNFNLISTSLLTNSVEICDVNNDGVERNYRLADLNAILFYSPVNGSAHYFRTQADAINNVNEISTADITAEFQFYVNYKTAFCTQTFGPISVRFIAAPILNTPIEFEVTTCDFRRDRTEPFEFIKILGPRITSDPTVTLRFYTTYEGAYEGTGPSLKIIKEGKYPVYARAEFPGGCFSIATVNLNITFTKVEAVDKADYICFDGTQDIAIDIEDYSPSMLLDPPLGITTTYFSTFADAELNENPISNLQSITQNGNFVKKTFYIRFEDQLECYAIKSLTINLVHVVINKKDFKICDFENNGEEVIVLSTISKEITGTQNATVSYFQNLEDAQNNRNAISSYLVKNKETLFVRILSFKCSEVFEIEISLGATPIIKAKLDIVRDSVCDNNNDGREPYNITQFESQIYTGTPTAVFQYYTGYNSVNQSLSGLIASPTKYIIGSSSTVYAKVSIPGDCYSVSTINIKLNFLPAIILKPAILRKCDYNFNLNESFRLEDATSQLFLPTENSNVLTDLKITYYKTEAEANAGLVATEVSSPHTTINSKTIVWARFTSKITSCYSVAPIELKTYLPPKARNSTILDLCDDNLDGQYNVNLTNFTTRMVYSQDEENVFNFFYTKADADAFTNKIIDPANFSFIPTLTRIWVRVENVSGCFDTAFVNLTLGNKIIFKDAGPFRADTCDTGNDGQENIDLTQFEKQIYSSNATFEYYPTILDINNYTNKITDPKAYFFNESAGPKIIYAKVSTAGFCPDVVEINLSLKKTPMFTLPDYYYCPGVPITIEPDFSTLNIIKFEWTNPAGDIISTNKILTGVVQEGIYKIKVTSSNNCIFTTTFNVYQYEVPIITKLVASGHSYTVIATGSKSILYSIDGVNFQASNVFHNLPYGVITFYVKFEGSDCLGEIRKGLILDIKNVFTPNDDGINDTWIIDDLYVFQGEKTNLKVFNRFQEKVFEQDSATKLVWDGKRLSRVVATDSYWYILTLADGRVFTGWVLLKNRN